MAEIRALAEVRLWGRTVGGVAELTDQRIVFEYDEAFRKSGLELSPVHLPLALSEPVAFDELRRKPAFNGLPGVLADALPDAFGNQVIRAYYAARGDEVSAFSPVQRLLYVGERALGALTFHPAETLPGRPVEQEPLEVAALVADARRIIEGTPDVAVPEIYRIGSSAGGMRPKAVVLYNEATGAIRSGFAPQRKGDVPCLLKFDGVAEAATSQRLGEPQPFNRVEAAYAHMAAAAGLEMADVRILAGAGDHAHLLVRRFDLVEGARLHQHSLGGLLHVDYNDIGASSYEECLRAILRLGMPPVAVEQGFRRMVFNVMAVNQDDHVKNLSFHMRSDGAWSLTPAYDVTFAKGGTWTREHQMRVAGKLSGISRADLLAVAHDFSVKRPERMLEEVSAAVSQWPRLAADAAVPAPIVAAVQVELDARAAQLAG